MTPKEKAKELVDKMYTEMSDFRITDDVLEEVAKQCALIVVHEIIEALHEHHWQNRLIIDYWEQVKQEIEKL